MNWRSDAHGPIVALSVVMVIFTGCGGRVDRAHKQPFKVCRGPSPQNSRCYADRYRQIVHGFGVARAFAELKADYASQRVVSSDCHQFAHVIGLAAVERSSRPEEIYRDGDRFCGAGYYHGATEALVARIGRHELSAQLNQLCARLTSESLWRDCAHGLGHGLMALEHGELLVALDVCDRLREGRARRECYGGVFMENGAPHGRRIMSSRFLRPKELLYPCTRVSSIYTGACYAYQADQALQAIDYDYSAVFRMCRGEPRALPREQCYFGVGGAAASEAIQDLLDAKVGGEVVKNRCASGVGFDSNARCIASAAANLVLNSRTDIADAVCNSVNRRIRPDCIRASRRQKRLLAAVHVAAKDPRVRHRVHR